MGRAVKSVDVVSGSIGVGRAVIVGCVDRRILWSGSVGLPLVESRGTEGKIGRLMCEIAAAYI